ncbi:MAG TPA: nitroreductase family protein [bacterium]|nr:nitroreductase family protein [bacterium]
MNVYSAILRRRSIRRYKEQPIPESVVYKLIDAARLAPSAGNVQPLEFVTICSPEGCEMVFPTLKWARHIQSGDTPPEGKRPTAYVIVLINRHVMSKGGGHEAGAAVQNIMLEALEEGLGTCWLRSIDRAGLSEKLGVPDKYEIDSVVAIGKPAEAPMTEAIKNDTVYWRDDRGVMHVPKRVTDNIHHREKF